MPLTETALSWPWHLTCVTVAPAKANLNALSAVWACAVVQRIVVALARGTASREAVIATARMGLFMACLLRSSGDHGRRSGRAGPWPPLGGLLFGRLASPGGP